MLKIKTLYLKNYCGYQEAMFDFTRPNGEFKPISAFFGPNGCGKTTCLNAIDFLGQAKQFLGRSNDLVFRKMTFHPDYDPTLPHFTKYEQDMYAVAAFDLEGEEKTVAVSSKANESGEVQGVVRNDLEGFRNVIFIDADNPMNMKRFQLPEDRSELFINIAQEVYGYKVDLGKPVQTFQKKWNPTGNDEIDQATYEQYEKEEVGESYVFYQDMTINKGDAIVHFKSMSDGERKISTLLRNLCDPAVINRSDIVMVDNIEMHVYFKRHARMVDKILSCFPEKQFIVTTHSGILIDHIGQTYGDDCLFDVSSIKGQPLLD